MYPFDQAQELERLAREKAIEYHQANMPKGESLKQCNDCGVDIPQARREAIVGVKTCVDCQVFNEEKGKLYATR